MMLLSARSITINLANKQQSTLLDCVDWQADWCYSDLHIQQSNGLDPDQDRHYAIILYFHLKSFKFRSAGCLINGVFH